MKKAMVLLAVGIAIMTASVCSAPDIARVASGGEADIILGGAAIERAENGNQA